MDQVQVGMGVRARGGWRRRWRGRWRVVELDKYNVVLLPERGEGGPLFFGPRTFWRYWERDGGRG